MRFSTASVVEECVWNLKMADFPRSQNRARINSLLNGEAPFSEEAVRENNITTNVNFLEGTQLAQDGRRQYANALMKPGNYFSVNLDSGPAHKQGEWGRIITKEINRQMKQSLPYMESLRSRFANVVTHGIGPVVWQDKDMWCPDPLGIEDVLVPSRTLVSLKNLPFFAIFRSYTVEQLHKMVTGPKVDPAWNVPLVNKAMKWASDQTGQSNNVGSDSYSPEKMVEMRKSDSGWFASDLVPTIDCYDFFFWSDDDKESGWNRRIVLDAEWGGGLGSSAISGSGAAPTTTKIGTRGEFLYDSGKRKYADKLDQIIHFQFGDLSAVAPFRYHSVRSLGFMLFAICHLQNRLRCKFNDAVFESLLQYFRVHNIEEAERALKINLIDKGIIDNSVEFIKAADRWQPRVDMAQAALAHNREIMGANSAGFTQDYDFGREKTEKTATQVTAESQAASALVGAMLSQAYAYQIFEYREDARRFCRPNSKDPDVRAFRLACLKQGVPEEFINSERWTIDPERVLGAGNKALEISIAEKLLAIKPQLDPEAGQKILHSYVLAVSDDPALANNLVPPTPIKVTDGVYYAQSIVGTLMQGLPVEPKLGINHIDVVDTLLKYLGMIVQGIEKSGGMTTPEKLTGLQNVMQNVALHVQIIAQDPQEKERVKKYSDALSQIGNLVKGYAQRLQEQAEKQNGQSQGPDPETVAKIQSQQMLTKSKIEASKESSAEKLAMKRISFEEKQTQDKQKHGLEMEKLVKQNLIELAAQEAKARQASQKKPT